MSLMLKHLKYNTSPAAYSMAGIQINRLFNYGGGHYHFAVRKDWAPLARNFKAGHPEMEYTRERRDAAGRARLRSCRSGEGHTVGSGGPNVRGLDTGEVLFALLRALR